MIQNVFNKLTVLPRGVVILIDQVLILFSVSLAFLLRFNFNVEEIRNFNPALGAVLCIAAALLSTLITKSYAGIVRYTGIQDGLRIVGTELLSLTIVVVFNLWYYYNFGKNVIPYSVVFISFFISSLLLYQYRLLVKNVFTYYKSDFSQRIPVIIFGAGAAGFLTKQAIEADVSSLYKLVAFLDDDLKKNNKEINGTRIYHSDRLSEIVKRHKAKKLVISSKNLSIERKNEIVDLALQYHLKVSYVPSFEKWLRNEWDMKQIRDINIEDLLGREVIRLDNPAIEKEIANRVICITGAAGSIGSELARQVLNYKPQTLVLIDQAESPLYEIERELRARNQQTRLFVFVASVCNKQRIHSIFRDFKPEIVFHAAAYKHVPLMESNPSEAVTTNIFGTRQLADLAVLHKVKKFVMISTDKAVNPTNIMGCSKRIAEIYVQSLDRHNSRLGMGRTSFVTTRFGNVLGSNGSVIPIFKDQILKGGPVTVTHPEITRFFMTIPEACELVIEAGSMGQGGEIFIFDMGKPVKIFDLAKKTIQLSGKELGKDIEIVFTGLRDGEKLYEELLNDHENTIPTHHEKILKAQVSEYLYDEVCQHLGLLEDLMGDKNELKMVALMKEIVPEFKSNYSRFEVLDVN
ncbi:NDP-sugar epimerase, includes UDP-GlcNAc-inverting 4,6-dehydratase FlaA1 and capsular polysaccharide biosynthesis protein EpsC [Chryseolinea serpens]|uniref:NDP-sugar epimerase, includes UDP-GlcNAc-inverting 4,6-dehydratase FlaA1 and capsular polysaccharide biosynthesis protein EpsC n=1 Tax=Chryseolinea serpens TaxID=947013 RepID=A0A1M5JHQ4_9BACT|nr:nucleoside-diphosphate sugar epimerase/dehydratase [Chryseolinea serpens]SHG40114.1 NDP-sugar epimerase, includes UDP-GlcNAc-inverting 4,6-dehydratase FlaA1 and capsular polysaccharide biosynthesis protein EpsC [Chryseolinea serpens]